MQTCPKCSGHRIHRSRAKTRIEELRKFFTATRLHRCHACGWRGWGMETSKHVPLDAPRREVAPLDLSALDAADTSTVARRNEAFK